LKELIENQMKIQNLENSLNEFYTFQEVAAVHPELSARSKLSFINMGAQMSKIPKIRSPSHATRSLSFKKSPRSQVKWSQGQRKQSPLDQNRSSIVSQRNTNNSVDTHVDST